MNDYSFRLETTAGRLYACVFAETYGLAVERLHTWVKRYNRSNRFKYSWFSLKALPTRQSVNDPSVLALWNLGPDSIGERWWYALGREADWMEYGRWLLAYAAVGPPVEERARAISKKQEEIWQRPRPTDDASSPSSSSG